jgi:hypothetical protein
MVILRQLVGDEKASVTNGKMTRRKIIVATRIGR